MFELQTLSMVMDKTPIKIAQLWRELGMDYILRPAINEGPNRWVWPAIQPYSHGTCGRSTPTHVSGVFGKFAQVICGICTSLIA
ncbi:MAG: hypothetical protein ACI97A_002312 [Planctomycetota bacterium]|jgi:hypothetical protein